MNGELSTVVRVWNVRESRLSTRCALNVASMPDGATLPPFAGVFDSLRCEAKENAYV
jgi:hypothetical protein